MAWDSEGELQQQRERKVPRTGAGRRRGMKGPEEFGPQGPLEERGTLGTEGPEEGSGLEGMGA